MNPKWLIRRLYFPEWVARRLARQERKRARAARAAEGETVPEPGKKETVKPAPAEVVRKREARPTDTTNIGGPSKTSEGTKLTAATDILDESVASDDTKIMIPPDFGSSVSRTSFPTGAELKFADNDSVKFGIGRGIRRFSQGSSSSRRTMSIGERLRDVSSIYLL